MRGCSGRTIEATSEYERNNLATARVAVYQMMIISNVLTVQDAAMSFVIGLATGYNTNKVIEERAIRQNIVGYLRRNGIRLTDRSGRTISAEEFIRQIFPERSVWRAIAIGSIVFVVVGIAALSGFWFWQML
jgi:hypothetical protein